MTITTEALRNIAVAGHGTTGKTILVESMLYSAGAIPRAESIESGKTVSDHTEEEIARQYSDFVGEVVAAFRAAECALIVVAARAGVQIETIKLWRRLNQREMPRMVFVNKLDEERADFTSAVSDLSEKFQMNFVPVTIPIGNGTNFKGIISLIDMKAYMVPADGGKEVPTEIPADMADADGHKPDRPAAGQQGGPRPRRIGNAKLGCCSTAELHWECCAKPRRFS